MFLSLVVKPVKKKALIQKELLKKRVYIIEYEKKQYFVSITTLEYAIRNDFAQYKVFPHIHIKQKQDDMKLISVLGESFWYGAKDSMIVDMQGIHSFLYARSKIFHDQTVRAILLSMQWLQSDKTYFRIGASGSPKTSYHPGGEVWESSWITGKDGGGISQTQSGYLPQKSFFSKRLGLYEPDKKTLRDDRALYSHTAWLTPEHRQKRNTLLFEFTVHESGVNVLESIHAVVCAVGIQAYALRIILSPQQQCKRLPHIVGRVLKHLPQKRIATVQEAAAIASEQTFALYPNQTAVLYGTNYSRRYRDWEAFRGGKRYEPHGHIHGVLLTRRQRKNQHNVFHVRGIFLSPNTLCYVMLTPIHKIMAIEPVKRKKDVFISTLNNNVLWQ